MSTTGTSVEHEAALARLDGWLAAADTHRRGSVPVPPRSARRSPHGPVAWRWRQALAVHRRAVEPCGC